MAGLADLLPYVFEHVTDLPRNMALRRLREGARLFGTETRAFKVIVAVPLVDGQVAYDISAQLPVGSEISNIDHVRIGDDPVAKRTYLQEKETAGNCAAGGGHSYFLQLAGGPSIHLDSEPKPGEVGKMMTIRLSVRPTLSGDLEDHWVSRYYEGIVAATMSLVYNMPDEKWSNVTASQRWASLMSGHIQTARRDVELESSNRVVYKTRYNG